ncbi:MAG: hypothetical protein JWN52_3769, partial [Actinomycetia bacterium]|nr:hypothetical protein [Actinomycetes bacterium]
MDSDMQCFNCRTPILSRARTGNQAVAWWTHCKACAALVEDQMTLVTSRPTEAKIAIYECRTCGTPRSCRTGWRTRCMVCLDERTCLPDDAANLAAKALDALSRRRSSDTVLPRMQVDDPREVWQQCALVVIADKVASLSWPGWTVLATDISGLPWEAATLLREPGRPQSHGTWARHDACGTV